MFKPKTRLGKLSLLLALIFIAYTFFSLVGAYRIDQSEPPTDSGALALALLFTPLSPAGLAGLTALIIGLIAVFSKKDRSTATVLSTIIGAITLIWILIGLGVFVWLLAAEAPPNETTVTMEEALERCHSTNGKYPSNTLEAEECTNLPFSVEEYQYLVAEDQQGYSLCQTKEVQWAMSFICVRGGSWVED